MERLHIALFNSQSKTGFEYSLLTSAQRENSRGRGSAWGIAARDSSPTNPKPVEHSLGEIEFRHTFAENDRDRSLKPAYYHPRVPFSDPS